MQSLKIFKKKRIFANSHIKIEIIQSTRNKTTDIIKYG